MNKIALDSFARELVKLSSMMDFSKLTAEQISKLLTRSNKKTMQSVTKKVNSGKIKTLPIPSAK